MAAVPIIAAGVGGLMSAVGAIQQGSAARQAGEYNAQVAGQNSALALQQGTEEARRYRIQARKQIGDMRANYGASGVQMEGSPLDYLEESAASAELDALSIEHGANVKAAGFGNEASSSRYEGRQAQKSGYFSAAGSLLSATGQALSYKKAPAPSRTS